jgi:arylsulfatase A-like enzyme
MFSLLTARLPLFSIELESREFQTARMVGLVDRLKAKGYRTALFMSGDLAFQSVDKFVAKRGFDKIADINNIGCSGARYVGSTSEWRNLDTMDDRCTVKAVMSWFDQPSPQPSLAIFWTGNTHWPYFSKPEPRPGEFSQNERLNRYLGALRTSDAAIGAMLDELTRRKALDDTLVIVLGDHGEAFGEHGFKAHGNTVFEEEVHIPLLIINGAIKGRSFATLGALSDLSPTILHLIGADPEPSWDGRSLFDPNRSGQVMLFAPNHQLSVGFREKDRKYIYETNSGLSRVFDLTNDPAERNNIADRQSAAYARRRSAGWIIHQNQRAMELRRRV